MNKFRFYLIYFMCYLFGDKKITFL